MKIYTKAGDCGETDLYGGQKIKKDHIRVETYGSVDELVALLGLARSLILHKEISNTIYHIQKQLMNIAGELATRDRERLSQVTDPSHVTFLENIIDLYSKKMGQTGNFIIPGDKVHTSSLHVARTACRRAERRLVTLDKEEGINPCILAYINRLSDTIYVMARYLEKMKMD